MSAHPRLAALVFACLLAVVVVSVPPAASEPVPTERAGRPIAPTLGVWLEEVVTDPLTDWDASGKATVSDEYVVLYNAGPEPVVIDGWALAMNDSTPETATLQGTIAAHDRLLVLNPPGQMNNDVGLELRDAAGVVRDQVALATSGIPSGNAVDVVAEAVHLAGPWAALAAPGTKGVGLPLVWLERVARDNGPDGARFEAPWVPAQQVTLRLQAHAAPDLEVAPVQLAAGSSTAAVTTEGAWWQVAPLAPAPSFKLTGNGWWSTTYPNGAPFTLRLDAAAPLIGNESAVRNATGHVRWLPSVTDAESGVESLRHFAVNASGMLELSGCAPHGDPAASCRVTGANATLRIEATDRAGQKTVKDVAIDTDTTPPAAPTDLRFEPGNPPHLVWTLPPEPLKAVRVEVANDEAGVLVEGAHELGATATSFVDTAWTPGDPRAYRVIVRDRADLQTATSWLPLPNETAPVQAEAVMDGIMEALVRNGSAEATVTFDRPMALAPLLVFEEDDGAVRHEAAGALAPDARSASYVVAPAVPVTPWGRGVWSLEGGEGQDGAPLGAWSLDVAWDLDAPTLSIEGAPATWVRASQHVVRLVAVDPVDPQPVVEVTTKPVGTVVVGTGQARNVTIGREGLHVVGGTLRDAAGNTRVFSVQIGMDATAPSIVENASRPSEWNQSAPFSVVVSDAVSGVNATSLRAWVANATAATDAVNVTWNGTQARITPSSGAWRGPFELYVAVADNAGNLAEGVVGRRLAVAAVAPATTEVVTGVPPKAAPAPAPQGPAWQQVGAPGGGGSPSGNGSFWDPQLWAPDAAVARASAPGAPVLGVAAAGAGVAATLGTVVHRARRRRREATARAQPDAACDVEPPQ